MSLKEEFNVKLAVFFDACSRTPLTIYCAAHALHCIMLYVYKDVSVMSTVDKVILFTVTPPIIMFVEIFALLIIGAIIAYVGDQVYKEIKTLTGKNKKPTYTSSITSKPSTIPSPSHREDLWEIVDREVQFMRVGTSSVKRCGCCSSKFTNELWAFRHDHAWHSVQYYCSLKCAENFESIAFGELVSYNLSGLFSSADPTPPPSSTGVKVFIK